MYALTDHLEALAEAAVSEGPDWSRARCSDGNGTLTHLFFSEDLIDIARAKAICSRCPLTSACLAAALERAEPCGVWGGHLLANGEIVHQKRKRGRPPKHPRPEPVVDEVIYPTYITFRSA
jgi:WhiB family transcriptional regulator, redox-sensing transcriptional regulator